MLYKTILSIAFLAMAMCIKAQEADTHAATKADSISLTDGESFTPPLNPQVIIDSLMKEYDFAQAALLIKTEINKARTTGDPLSLLQRQLKQAQKGLTMLPATEKVIFIDSIVVSRSEVLNHIALDAGCGHFISQNGVANITGHAQTTAETGFCNDYNDHLLYTIHNGNSAVIATADRFANKWTEGTPLPGLTDDNAVQAFPFITSDGQTLYFAANDKNSLGGYDIYVTRLNKESNTYYKPQNLGMPFSSTANDYLFAYDDFNELGWFVSDRYQPADKVCIYIFIPTHRKEIYENIDEALLRNYASLRSIVATQTGHETQAAQARERLKTARAQKQMHTQP